MKLSDAILAGTMLVKFDPSVWLEADGSCGCAIGGAVVAAGFSKSFLIEAAHRNMSFASAGFLPCIENAWPWLNCEHIKIISKYAWRIKDGMATLEDLLNYVRANEAAYEARIQSQAQVEAETHETAGVVGLKC